MAILRILPLLAAVLTLAVAPEAMAVTSVYTYAGSNYTTIVDNTPPVGATYSTSMSVTGTIQVLGAPLPANMPLTDISGSLVSYSLSDGAHTHTQANSAPVGAVSVATDATGAISEWQMTTADTGALGGTGSPGDQRQVILTSAIVGFVLDRGILQECVSPSGCGSIFTDVGQVANSAGAWTLVPEPSTALLLAAGLAPFAYLKRRRA